MAEHFTRATESTLKWCGRCHRHTKHAVSDGREGRCLEHDAPRETRKQQQAREKRERESREPKLF